MRFTNRRLAALLLIFAASIACCKEVDAQTLADSPLESIPDSFREAIAEDTLYVDAVDEHEIADKRIIMPPTVRLLWHNPADETSRADQTIDLLPPGVAQPDLQTPEFTKPSDQMPHRSEGLSEEMVPQQILPLDEFTPSHSVLESHPAADIQAPTASPAQQRMAARTNASMPYVLGAEVRGQPHYVIRSPRPLVPEKPKQHSKHNPGEMFGSASQPTIHHQSENYEYPPEAISNQPEPMVGQHPSLLDQAGDMAFSNYSHQDHLPAPPIHGAHRKFGIKKWPGGPIQPSTATLPGGHERPMWKQPYSYGYFGASGSRSWSKHSGYRDRSTEFRFR